MEISHTVRMRDVSSPVWPGEHQPLGATWAEEATNFAVFAPDAITVEVCLLDDGPHGTDGPDGPDGLVETRHRLTERTLGIWHGAVPGVPVGQRYGFRADGPWEPARGWRFNPAKLLLDPYARAVSGAVRLDDALYGHVRPEARDDAATTAKKLATRDGRDSAPYVPLSVVVHDDFDWGSDAAPRVRWTDTVMYELHVKGFTELHDRVPEKLRGTYAGLGAPAVIDYLQDLGITSVELMPIHEIVTEPHVTGLGLTNYWGYNTIGYFAPHHGYSAGGDRGGQVSEFKQMVKTFHAAGIEVILDVVYNHTAEGGTDGPTLCFRGLDDHGYYKRLHAGHDPYFDVTGCGNTLDTTYLPALRLILDSLRFWVTEMHVDGFRFDLAPALARDRTAVDLRGAFLTTMSQDPVLRHVKLIAEPWDASMDGYQVGRFPPPWVEWNDRYRDAVRDFWRSGSGGIREVALRLSGSSDLYADDGRSPYASVNFVTAHDGFTLRDLVSYNEKHNQGNGEDNRDGSADNRSWNCGVEGETDDVEVIALRRRQAANMMVTLCLSNGVPMITAGDERGRTQRGNNNAYSQDNEISWMDWRPDEAWLDLYETTKAALRLRRDHPALRQRHFLEGRPAVEGGPKDLAWIHPEGREMTDHDWFDDNLHTVGMFVSGDPLRAAGQRGERLSDSSFLMWFHAHSSPGKVTVPKDDRGRTAEIVLSTDTGHHVGEKLSPGDVIDMAPRSLVVVRQL